MAASPTRSIASRSQSQKYAMEYPKITILTAVFNAVSELEATIQSVLDQKYRSIEYIIIDGGSTDGTVDMIRKYASALAFWISEPDRGISDAWNKGLSHSTGDYVGFLNAGDRYMPEAVASVALQVGYADFVWGDMIWQGAGEGEVFKGRESYASIVRYVMPFNHPSMFFKRSTINRVGGYDLKYRYAMDYDLVRKIISDGGSGHYIPSVVATMASGGIHDRNYAKTVAEVERIAVSHKTSRVMASLARRYTLGVHEKSFLIVPARALVRLIKNLMRGL